MTARESHVVELVDGRGAPIGSATVDEAHREPGLLHRAFSVFLRDPVDGRVLVQQRAAVKTRFPLRWANSCCGHPLPGEDVEVAAGRRLAEELGVSGVSLVPVGVYTYRAADPSTGRVEHEYDHVLLGDLPLGVRLRPDPDEVADVRWVSVPALRAALEADAPSYAPWLSGVTTCLAEYLGRVAHVPRPSEGPVDLAPFAGGPVRADSSVSDEAPERSGGR